MYICIRLKNSVHKSQASFVPLCILIVILPSCIQELEAYDYVENPGKLL